MLMVFVESSSSFLFRFFTSVNLRIKKRKRNQKLLLTSNMDLNPYHAGQILPILRCVPSVTKVTLLHFIHALPSVTKVSATIVL